jgi:Yip1 domain
MKGKAMDGTKLMDARYAEIFISPRTTIRGIVDRNPRDKVIALVVLCGFISAVASALQFRSPQAFTIGSRSIPMIAPATMWKIRLGQIIASPFLAVMFLYVNGAVLRWSGGLFGGTAKPVEVRAALGWASVPSILIGFILIAVTLIHPPAVITMSEQQSPLSILAHDWMTLALSTVLGLYAFVILLNCIAEVHRFSASRALAAWSVQWLLLMGAFMVMAMTVPLVAVFFFR